MIYKPDYRGGSIVNLMSSISASFNVKSRYSSLKLLKKEKLYRYRNIVLLILDGLGYEYFINNGRNTYLSKHLKGRITSVFPSTTACAMMTFATGQAPEKHTSIGWHMFLKEMGVDTTVLPFVTRSGEIPLKMERQSWNDLFPVKSLSNKIKNTYYVVPKHIIGSTYLQKPNKLVSFTNINSFFSKLGKTIKSSNKRKYIHAYWEVIDYLIHRKGTKSSVVKNHLKAIDKKIESFVKSIEGTNTLIIVTADHGLKDGPMKYRIDVSKHPNLMETLTLRMTGDKRAANCFVRPSKVKQFESYVKKNFSKKCYLFKGEDLIRKKFFGLYKPDKKLYDRVGDYMLLTKGNYYFYQPLLGGGKSKAIAYHGGISKEEMFVPLFVIKS